MPKAFSYIRFSTAEQARGDSLRRQTAWTEKWCRERGVMLDETLQDVGISAFRGANRTIGALKSFLDLVEAGRIESGSYLIVESLDRLSRETVLDAATHLFALIRAGITVVTLTDGQEYSLSRLQGDWTPLIFSLVVMARAHDESKVKSDRVAEAWKQKKALARTERKPLTHRCPEWLELRGGKFSERIERVEVVRRVFRETIEGFGRREIARRFNAEGIPAFRGTRGWHASSIAKILGSRSVLGEYQPHTGSHKARNRHPDGEPIYDFYPPIVDEETFWRAQAAIESRRSSAAGRKGDAGGHILQGLARCASCGGPMHIINKGRPPKGAVYLSCSAAQRRAGCGNSRRWRVDKLEPALLTGLSFLEAGAFGVLDDKCTTAAQRLDAIGAQLSDAQDRERRLLALFETGLETAVERYKAVAEEVKRIKKELRRARDEAAKLAADPGLVDRLTTAANISRQLEEGATGEARRELRIRLAAVIRGLVEQIECDPEVGAVMVLKPRLGPRELNGVVPFAFKSSESLGGIRMLIDEADETTIDEFLGWNSSFWSD